MTLPSPEAPQGEAAEAPLQDPNTCPADWKHVDREAEAQEQAKREKLMAEAAQWQGEINTLMGRAAHPERNVEYVDLDTGKVVLPVIKNDQPCHPPGSIMAMPLFYSPAEFDGIITRLARKDELFMAIQKISTEKLETPDAVAYANHQADVFKAELGMTIRWLYAHLTANPLITEDWLAENPDKWRPVDLNTLIMRFRVRNAEVRARIASFRK